jgi:hypothetical protein
MRAAFGLDFKTVQKNFFKSPHVVHALDSVQYHYLRFQGMNIRKTARKNVMQGRGTAPKPKKATKRGSGLAVIYYSFEKVRRSVIIGPIGFLGQPWKEKTVPELLEYGGTVRPKKPGFGRFTPKHYDPHPYMRPALHENLTQAEQKKVWDAARRKAGV